MPEQTKQPHEHRPIFVSHSPYEDEELYRLSGGRHGGPVSLYRCCVEGCKYAEYR